MSVLKTFALACVLAGIPGSFGAFAQSSDSGHGDGPVTFSFQQAGGSYLGVFVAEIDADRAKALKLPDERGVEITHLENDSPADKAGLKPGDVVTKYDGQPVEGMEQFRRLIRETPAGRRATLTVIRNGATQTVGVVVGAIKPHAFAFQNPGSIEINGPEIVTPQIMVPDLPQILPGSKSIVLGVETEPLSPQLAHYFGVDGGVLIRSVLSGMPAEKAGLRAGDVITRADETDIASPGRLSVVVRAALAGHHPLSLKIVRNKQPLSLTIPLDQDQGRGTIPNGPGAKQRNH